MTLLYKPEPAGSEIHSRELAYARWMSILLMGQWSTIATRVANGIYYLMIILIIAWIGSMAIDRSDPIRMNSRALVTTKVKLGERALVISHFVPLRECSFSRRWSIVDGVGRRIDFDPQIFAIYGKPGEPQGPIVPLDAAPGKASFRTVIAYECNILQRALSWSIVRELPDLPFEILPQSNRRR